MGFRNPFRIQVDENDVAYVSDYSPDANNPQRSRGPVGRRPLPDRPQAGELRLPDVLLEHARLLPVELQRERRRWTTPPQPIDCGANPFINDSRWNLEGGPGNLPGLREIPPIADPIIWYSYNDNRAVNPLGTPCFGYYATTPGPIAPGSTHGVPEAVPGALHGRRRAPRDRQVQLRPGEPEPAEVPALLRRVGDPGRVHAGHAPRAQDRLAEPGVQDQLVPALRSGERRQLARSCSSATTRWTCSGAPTAPSTCSPTVTGSSPPTPTQACTSGSTSRARGHRSPCSPTDKTDGALPLTVNFSSAGSNDPDPGDSITFDWNFGDGTAHSIDPNPSAHLHGARPLHGGADGHRLVRQVDLGEHGDHGRQHSPTVVVNTPVAGGTFAFGDDIPFTVTVTDPEDGAINCADVRSRSCSVTTRTGTARPA